MNAYSAKSFPDQKPYFKTPFETRSIVQDPKTNKFSLLFILQSDAPPGSFKKIDDLLHFSCQKVVPSFIPMVSKNEINSNVSYLFEDAVSSLEDLINMKETLFSFNEILGYFKTIVNGMAFLEMNQKLANLKPNALFLTANKTVKCSEIIEFSEEALSQGMENLRALMILLCNPNRFKDVKDILEMNERKSEEFFEDLRKRFRMELENMEEIKKAEMFIGILRKVWVRKKGKKINFLELFGKCLQLGDKSSLENAILAIDGKICEILIYNFHFFLIFGAILVFWNFFYCKLVFENFFLILKKIFIFFLGEDEKKTFSSKKSLESTSTEDSLSMPSIKNLLCSSFDFKVEPSEKPSFPDSSELYNCGKEKFELINDTGTIVTFGLASKKYSGKVSKEKYSEKKYFMMN